MPHAEVLWHRTLYQHPDHYCAWPALIRAANGDLLLAFIRTTEHMHPDGAIVTMRSRDNGATWSDPGVAFDTPIDDRECGLTLLPDGRIVMHVWSTFWRAENYTCLPFDAYPPALIQAWVKQVNAPAYRAEAGRHGGWAIVSRDHGHTWSTPVRGPDTVHGGIALPDGSLLVAGYRHDGGHIGLYGAPQPEGPWTRQAVVQCPTPDTHHFGEPHLARLPSGRIVLLIRYTARAYDDRRDDLGQAVQRGEVSRGAAMRRTNIAEDVGGQELQSDPNAEREQEIDPEQYAEELTFEQALAGGKGKTYGVSPGEVEQAIAALQKKGALKCDKPPVQLTIGLMY
jgi:hypothetical protein